MNTNMTVKELKQLAKDYELKGYSRLNKEELIEFLYEADVLRIDEHTGKLFDCVVNGYYTDGMEAFETLANAADHYETTEEKLYEEMDSCEDDDDDTGLFWTEGQPVQPNIERVKNSVKERNLPAETLNEIREWKDVDNKRHETDEWENREKHEARKEELYKSIQEKAGILFPELTALVEKEVTSYKQDFYIYTIQEMLVHNKNGILQLRTHGVDYVYYDKWTKQYKQLGYMDYHLPPFVRRLNANEINPNYTRKDDCLKYYQIKNGKIVKQLSPMKALKTLVNYQLYNNDPERNAR